MQDRFGAYAGIGVRIEDDVVCTESGVDVLSSGVPSDPDEVPTPTIKPLHIFVANSLSLFIKKMFFEIYMNNYQRSLDVEWKSLILSVIMQGNDMGYLCTVRGIT